MTKKKGGKIALQLSCQRCGCKKRAVGQTPAIVKIIDHPPRELVVVVGKKEQKLQTLPTVKNQCLKCGNKLAYAWIVQTSDLERPSTQFFRCTKCSCTQRENS